MTKHKETQLLRRLLGLPRKPCDPLTYSGRGKIDVCVACLVESQEFKRQLSDVARLFPIR